MLAGTIIDYIIDAKNRRIGKKVNGVLTEGFLYQDGLHPVAWLNGDGTVKARFVWGNQINTPEYMEMNGHTYRYVSDYVGSPVMLVDVQGAKSSSTPQFFMDFNISNQSPTRPLHYHPHDHAHSPMQACLWIKPDTRDLSHAVATRAERP